MPSVKEMSPGRKQEIPSLPKPSLFPTSTSSALPQILSAPIEVSPFPLTAGGNENSTPSTS